MIWILAVSVCGAALSASAENTQNGAVLSAQETQTATLADAAADAEAEAELELFLPESYEQYLELENPSDFAISENYIAVADRTTGNTDSVIYICDRTQRSYKVLPNAGQSPKSLNFYTDGDGKTYLYYVLSDNTVFKVDLSAETYEQELIEGFTCFSLIIWGDTVLSSRTQGDATIYRSDIDTIGERTQIAQYQDCNNPVFALYGDSVYLAANTDVYIYNGSEFVPQGKSINIIDSFAVYSAEPSFSFYYTAGNGSLFRNINESETPLFDSADCFSELGYSDGNVYVLNSLHDSVCGITNGAFNGYEIGKYSDNANRIGQGASDIFLTDDKLLIADTNNSRVLIADLQTGSTIEVSASEPKFVCGGEDNFIVSDSRYVYIYSYEGTRLYSFTADTFGNGTLAGCAYSYGKYYLVGSGSSANGIIEADGNGGYSFTPSSASFSPTAVTCDVYGNIYILSGNSVFKHTEETFLSGTGGGPAFYAPEGTLKILPDYTGAMYAVAASGVYLLDATRYTPVLDSQSLSSLVYGGEADFSALSFTFDFESGEMYILSDGFIARADLGANAPASLENIAADGLYGLLIGAPADADAAKNMLVSVPAGSVLLPVADAEGIDGQTSVFPYSGYLRTDDRRTGVALGQLDAGTLVAFYEYTASAESGVPAGRDYTLALVLDDKQRTDDDPTVLTDCYTEVSSYTGYTTNDVGLYRLPLMRAGNATVFSNGIADRLDKSSRVIVYGIVGSVADENAPGYGTDCEYYFVAASVGGETVYGFIPTSYVLNYDSSVDWSDSGSFTFRNVARGETITLSRTEGDSTFTLDLSDEEQVKVYGEPNEENLVYVTYTDADGILWSGMVNADLLYEAGPSTLVILAVVAVVVAAVLVSTCYLILRKQPMMQ